MSLFFVLVLIYSLKEEYSRLKNVTYVKCKNVSLIRQVAKPEEIVNLIKKDISDGTIFKQPLPVSEESSKSSDEEKSSEQNYTAISNDSQLIRAKWLVENKKVIHVPQCKAFNVLNETDVPYFIRLYPSSTFTCKAQSNCCRIMAVQMSFGIQINEQKSKLNLSRLRRIIRPVPRPIPIFSIINPVPMLRILVHIPIPK